MLKKLSDDDVKFKSLEYYIRLKQKWNKDRYGVPWRDKFASRSSIGSCMWLCNKFKPVSYEDFYEKYLESGKDTDADKKFRGRTVEELEDIAIRWQEECGDYETPLSEFYDVIVLHVIIETYMGKDFENRAVRFLRENGVVIEHGTDEEDTEMSIDLKIMKDGKVSSFLQVKPISFFVGNRHHTVFDRLRAFSKHVKGHEAYPNVPYRYLMYDSTTAKWVYNNDRSRFVFDYDEIVNVQGDCLKSAYLLRKHEFDELFKRKIAE